MLFQEENIQKCVLCNNTEFYKQDGYFFCNTCQTQNEDVIEEIFEERYDNITKLRKTTIKTTKSDKTHVIGWTSWELYNFVLLGLTNQLIEIGVDRRIKLTVLQLWTQYLSKLEVAFTSKNKKCIPKMARRFHKKDAEIIYGKIKQKKTEKKKKQLTKITTSSMISSYISDGSISTKELNKSKKLLVALEYEKYRQHQTSSNTTSIHSVNESLQSLKSDNTQSFNNTFKIRFNKKAKLEAKKIKAMSKNFPCSKKTIYCKTHVTTQYATGPHIVTPLKLLSIIYLALRIDNFNISISDMIRFSREGHLSYYKLDHLIPSEIILTKSDINLLTNTSNITHRGIRKTAAAIAKFLKIYEFTSPDFKTLIKRFCEDLELPRGILLYTERIFLSLPSIMKFTSKSSLIPNYEGRAMAYIIIVLKILFSLDDLTEKEISRIAEKINKISSEKEISTTTLFSFCEWQKYIECRKTILTNLHFPSKIKYDPECIGISHLYLRFMSLMKSKKETKEYEATNCKYFISQNLTDAFYHCIEKLNDKLIPLKEMEIFSPSFTPLQSYINQLKKNPYYEISSMLKNNFYEAKVGYMTKPNLLVELAAQCKIKLEVIDCSIRYLEKIVSPFEQTRILTLEELNKPVKVEALEKSLKIHIKKSDNLLDYSHKNRMCKLKINFQNFKYYSLVYNFQKFNKTKEHNFFEQILFDGLNIHDSNSDDEKCLNNSKTKEIVWTDSNLLNRNFFQKYNINLYYHEIESLKHTKKAFKEKYIPCRDATGKFIKSSIENRRKIAKKHQKNKIRDFNSFPCEFNQINIIPEYHMKNNQCISILNNDNVKSINNLHNSFLTDFEILFRPYKDYWMYQCIFSRVKGKNFKLFEKELPENFIWLLNECANIVEMSMEDLYEEVCLIESHYFNTFKTKKSQDNLGEFQKDYYKSKSYSNNILNKW